MNSRVGPTRAGRAHFVDQVLVYTSQIGLVLGKGNMLVADMRPRRVVRAEPDHHGVVSEGGREGRSWDRSEVAMQQSDYRLQQWPDSRH